MLLVHVQLSTWQDCYVLFCRTAFQLSGRQHVLVPGAVPPQTQDFKFVLVELHEVSLISFLQPVRVPLDAQPSGAICPRFTSSANLLTIYSVPSSRLFMKMLNNTGPNIDPFSTLVNWPTSTLCITDHYPLGPAFKPSHYPLIQTTQQQFV